MKSRVGHRAQSRARWVRTRDRGEGTLRPCVRPLWGWRQASGPRSPPLSDASAGTSLGHQGMGVDGGQTVSGREGPHFPPADSRKCSRVPWGALCCPPIPTGCPTQAQDPKTPVPAPGSPKAGPPASSSAVGKLRPVVVPRHPGHTVGEAVQALLLPSLGLCVSLGHAHIPAHPPAHTLEPVPQGPAGKWGF